MGLRGPGAAKLKAVRKHANDNAKPLAWSDPSLTRAGKVCAFLESLPITSGPLAGTLMVLRPWQRAIVEAIYATDAVGAAELRCSKETIRRARKQLTHDVAVDAKRTGLDGNRLVRTALISLPRKNGKT